MNTFAYTLVAVGFIILHMATRGRRFTDLPKDFGDMAVALVTFDTEGMSEVLQRRTEAVSNTSGFTAAASTGAAAVDAIAGVSGNAGQAGPSGKTVGDLIALGKALQAKGFRVSENKALGDNPRPGVHMASGYHYKYDNSGAIDVNWPNASQEARMFDALVPQIRAQGFHVLWRVKNHYNHMHVDISRKDI